MKILTFTTLYPNNIQQRHGIFVEQRLKKLVESKIIEVKVIAPIPWFPFQSEKFGAYSKYPQVAKQENRLGIEIFHPRYIVIPKIGMTIAPFLLAFAVIPLIQKMIREGFDFDLIDAHYYYPDGIAATILGKLFKKPVTITARGSDINLISQYLLPKQMIVWAAGQSEASITVSDALKEKLLSLGVNNSKVYALRNGVDLSFFLPKNRVELREQKNITRICLLSVGNLIELKGHHLIIEAMCQLPNYQLMIAGDGAEFDSLNQLVNNLQLHDRVKFLGSLNHQHLVDIYNIADALILASSREGMANVLLESMACGTPVVATNVGGTPEVVKHSAAGVLINERTPQAIAKGVINLFNNYPDRTATRKYAENFSWQQTVESLSDLFRKIVGKSLIGN